jgi:hypothetical protein
MQATPQGRGSVWEHCEQTAHCAQELVCALGLPKAELLDWQQRLGVNWLPPELFEPQAAARLQAVDASRLLTYLAWHDCGKPFVWQLDEQGRSHYPQHAEVSAEIWLQADGSPEEAELMRLDMLLHTCSAQELEGFAKHPLLDTLVLASWAALWANAQDFGGTSSSSFLAKRKQLLRRTRAAFRQGTAYTT